MRGSFGFRVVGIRLTTIHANHSVTAHYFRHLTEQPTGAVSDG